MSPDVIVSRRGAFRSLPCWGAMNDLEIGSYFFFWGSIGCVCASLVPLMFLMGGDIVTMKYMDAVNDTWQWFLLCVSGVFYSLGSYALVRAFREEPIPPLFTCEVIGSDELLAMWMYMIGTVPFIFLGLLYYSEHPGTLYFLATIGAIIMNIVCALFIHSTYESAVPKDAFLSCLLCLLGKDRKRCHGVRSWLSKHFQNDWLAGCWILLVANVLLLFISLLFSVGAIATGSTSKEIFVWVSSFVNMLLFTLGSLYFVAGSYPWTGQFYMRPNRHRSRFSLADVGVAAQLDRGEDTNDGYSDSEDQKICGVGQREEETGLNAYSNSRGQYGSM